MLASNGNVKLIDFGISIFHRPGEQHNQRAGSPAYMAPEIIKGNYGKECDIWSLGVLLYKILTKKLPFNGINGDNN